MNLWPSHDILDALGWTLLHFLWQGLVIAVLLAVALRLFRGRSANLRYLAGCLALLLMTLAPVATYFSLTDPDESETPEFIIQNASVSYGNLEVRPAAGEPSSALPTTTKLSVPKTTLPELLEMSLPWLVTAWSLGVFALSCRLFAGWLLIQRLRRTATTALLDPWQTKLKQLAARVGVSRRLRLLQSAWVEVPTVIGWLRPVILLPASCLTGLTPEQLESILAHELAHIHRHDYLINLLQNVVETLLFYHPAVWWVSRRIRQEREHCCDDLAVKICGDPLEYARALATLEELRPAPAQLQLAASGAPLLERIRRLAGQPERSAARPAWPVAGVIAVLLLALLIAGLRNNPASAQSAAEPAAANQSEILSAKTNPITPSNNPNFATQLRKPPLPANNLAQTNSSSPPSIELKVQFAELDLTKVGTNGFAWPFKDGEFSNLTEFPATFQYSEWLIVEPTNSGAHDQYVYVHTNSHNAPLSLLLNQSQYESAIANLKQQDGSDLLTTPKTISESGRPVEIQAIDLLSILVGGFRPGETNGPHMITNLPSGPILDLTPRLSPDAHSLEMTVNGQIAEFVGYENPATITNQYGKPMPKDWAIPHLRDRSFFAGVTMTNGQTLVLGSQPVPITTRQQIKQKVPFLGSLPFLGHLFRSTYVTTNTTQKVLMLFVTPTLINADGTRYHSASADQNTNGESASRTNLVYTSKGRQAIISKLDRIRVDSVAYDHLPLSEVINNLTAIAKARDPEKIGINFFISREAVSSVGAAPGAIDPFTGLPVAPLATDVGADITSATITINPALKDVRLADVLNAITKSSNIPIKYSIKDHAVVFSLRNPNEVPLEIRTFHVDQDAFARNLGLELTNTTNGFKIFAVSSNEPDLFSASVRRFFAAAGVDFDTNNPANVGKAVAYTSRKSILMVRATHEDLDLIAAAIETLNQQTPQIKLKVRFTLMDASTNAAIGFNLDTTNLPQAGQENSYQPPFTDLNSAQVGIKLPSNPSSHALQAPQIASLTGILTEPQYQAALHALEEKRKDVQFLDAPEITAESGRRAQIEAVGSQTNATQNSAQPSNNGGIVAVQNSVYGPISIQPVKPGTHPIPFNPVLDVLPRVSEDNYSIQLNIVSTITQFMGNLDHGVPKTDMEGNIIGVAPSGKPTPYYYTLQSTNDVTLWDGQTFMFSTRIPQPLGPAENSSIKNTGAADLSQRTFTVFITPTIINPDGTPFHTKKEQALHQSTATPPAK